MPLSAVELCAAALVKIGARPIAVLRGRRRPRPRARAASIRSPATLLLGVHPWSFTLAQARLLARARAAARRLRQCVHPAGRPSADDLGRHRRPQPGRGLSRPGRAASCAMPSEIVLNYQRRVPTRASCRPSSCPLLVTRLAAEFCIPLTEGSSRAMDLYRLAEAELRSARLIDSQQATPQRVRGLHPDRGPPLMSRAFRHQDQLHRR